jgi:6-phosphogluconolactonase (cycloisomerase 2 family)
MRIATDGSVSDLVPKRVTAGAEPRGIAAHPSGEFLYVANNGDATISEFAIAADGGLSPLRSLPVPVSTGAPTSLVMDPAGRVLFLISYTPGAGAITSFTIASNGTLTEGHTAYAAVFTSLGSAQPTSSGSGTTYLFTAGGGDGPGVPPEVRTFAVKDDGTVDYADAFYSPASVPKVYLGPVFADPSRRVVYVARSSGSMVPFSVGDTGTIAEVPGGAASFAGSAQNMKMNPAHDRLYVAGLGPAQVWQYAVAADGSLAALSPPAVATPTPYGIEMNPGGTRVYALNGSATGAASNLVSVFDVAADGTLNAH